MNLILIVSRLWLLMLLLLMLLFLFVFVLFFLLFSCYLYSLQTAADDDGATGVDDEFDIYEDLELDTIVKLDGDDEKDLGGEGTDEEGGGESMFLSIGVCVYTACVCVYICSGVSIVCERCSSKSSSDKGKSARKSRYS